MAYRDRRMDRAARLRVNQGDNEGVDSVSMTEWASADLPVRSAREAPPQVIFYETGSKIIPKFSFYDFTNTVSCVIL